MKTTCGRLCLYVSISVALVVFVVSAARAQTPPCGEHLSVEAIWQDVPALSNGIYQRGQNGGGSCGGRGQHGLRYQCVEYIVGVAVQRGFDIQPWLWTDAVTFFDQSKSDTLGMVRIVNGGPDTLSPAQPDDILVFSSTATNPYGHIAVVSNVSQDGNTVTIIEQNWSDTGLATLTRKAGTGERYELNQRGSYKVLGWLRKSAPPPPPTNTQNLLINGGFESGDTTGYSLSGNAVITNDPLRAAGSMFALVFNGGESLPNAILSQSFNTVRGQPYRFSFDFAAHNNSNWTQGVRVKLFGLTLLYAGDFTDNTGGNQIVYDHHSLEFTADSAVTTVTIEDIATGTTGQDGYLDNLSVIPPN